MRRSLRWRHPVTRTIPRMLTVQRFPWAYRSFEGTPRLESSALFDSATTTGTAPAGRTETGESLTTAAGVAPSAHPLEDDDAGGDEHEQQHGHPDREPTDCSNRSHQRAIRASRPNPSPAAEHPPMAASSEHLAMRERPGS